MSLPMLFNDDFPTVDVKRELAAMRMLDGKWTEENRDFVRAAMCVKYEHFIRFRDSRRLRELMQLSARSAGA